MLSRPGATTTQPLIVTIAGLSVLAALLPGLVASARAVAGDWLPISDNAYFAIRAHDVLSGQVPLLGMATSVSLEAERALSHPGPLLFDLLAVPVTLLASANGIAIGIGLLNAAMIVGLALVSFRIGGAGLVVVAMLPTAALCWSMGSELLFDPWQPHSLLLPFLCWLFLVWGMTTGDVILPWAAAVGSLIVQSHISYGSIWSPALALWGATALGLRLRARWRVLEQEDPADHDPDLAARPDRDPARDRAAFARQLRMIGAVTALVLSWAGPSRSSSRSPATATSWHSRQRRGTPAPPRWAAPGHCG